ncbi:RNA 2'-phosphotransferase [Planktothricoides sp. SR001]|uniref:RNA 2'-phosphotransferase n=1 Tax=Planktothricoides sp. SR001 TaxID=1705388 RepID=UPI000A6D29FA
MMHQSRLVKISKYLSYHLRHQPEKLGLTLDVSGWVPVEMLLAAAAKDGFPISADELQAVVAKNDKKRFSFDETKGKIRANQGHSVAVDLQLAAVKPPEKLYHGTAASAVDSILKQGLQKMSRHHVHLSAEIAIAKKVGERHGRPVVFMVDAAAMDAQGYPFYRSDNGVWLVDKVPPEFLQLLQQLQQIT